MLSIKSEIKKEIAQIYKREYGLGAFYIFEQIPVDKLRFAVNRYAPLQQDETVVCLFDDTNGKTCKDGFVLTTRHLYYKQMMVSALKIDISSIQYMTAKKGLLSSTLTIHSYTGQDHIAISTSNNNIGVCNVLYGMITLLQSKGHDIYSTGEAKANENKPACPGCGATLPDACKFCVACGHKIMQQKQDMFCKECGARFNDDAKFCHGCGASRSAGSQQKQMGGPGVITAPEDKRLFICLTCGDNYSHILPQNCYGCDADLSKVTTGNDDDNIYFCDTCKYYFLGTPSCCAKCGIVFNRVSDDDDDSEGGSGVGEFIGAVAGGIIREILS